MYAIATKHENHVSPAFKLIQRCFQLTAVEKQTFLYYTAKHVVSNFRKSDVREIKVMRTRDQRFTDIAPKVYHTVCNPFKVMPESYSVSGAWENRNERA